jgi:hypothetical protein
MGCPHPPLESCCDRRGKGDRLARTRSAKMLERARGFAEDLCSTRFLLGRFLLGVGDSYRGVRRGERISMLTIAGQDRSPVPLEIDPNLGEKY